MNNRNTMLRRYYRRIRNFLPCSGKMKSRILTAIRTNVDYFLEENPHAEFGHIQARFGSPEAVATGYLSEMGEKELLESLNISQRTYRISVCTFLLLVLLWAAAGGIAFVHAQNSVYPGADQVIAQHDAAQP